MIEEQRPQLTERLNAAELLRWYWLKDELSDFARSLGVRSTGGKELLTRRIAAKLDGTPFVEPIRQSRGGGAQLTGPLTATTVIPVGQRCSQVVRAWFVDQVGPSFWFDAEMRAFFAGADGMLTLQDALDHYFATRGQGTKRIDEQFEYNRFTRAWHEANPSGERAELLHAWQEYRSRPVDRRGKV
ncbi:hypothetical protein EDF62_2849 [Leucobacter luti]|uniref:DUF6434 domain-containing protein n=1 Tax=Leucobacter luti TaxID=340320 RepID=A0A4R6RTQ2_9MICO|nr:DUF6434 domain-containing protein [Leucobacter luti]TDP90281.1 hypothetical protein EDF62_2849 [Leucobacter luti]